MSQADEDVISISTTPQTGSYARPVHQSVTTEQSNHNVDNGSLELLAAASRDSAHIDPAPPLHQPRRADQPRMRSSIACARCRRSKVKCLNNGINTPCRACVTSGRECVYPAPATSDRSHRRDGSLGRAADTPGGPDGPRSARSKPRKLQSLFLGSHSSIRAPVDALNTNVVTPLVWLELFEIWQQHFSIDLPFLHPTGFTKLLRDAKSAPVIQDFSTPKADSPSDLPAIPQELLLAFLTLTSRFHPALIAHHAPVSGGRQSNPQIATEYYATVCRDKLLSLSDGAPDLARVQSLLMLAFHEWGDGQPVRAWTYLGEAIRFAKMLGYGIPDPGDDQLSIVEPITNRSSQFPLASEDALQDQETRRRTFWACFTLERHLSSGPFRSLSIHMSDARIPLPSSEKSYLFNDRVKTPYISDWADELQRTNGMQVSVSAEQNANVTGSAPRGRENFENCIWETGPGEGALSRYVKASELFNSVLQWAGRGGRLREQLPPWDPQSTWHKLDHSIRLSIEKLPRDLTLSQANISAHIQTRSSVSYTLLHTSLLLSKMILHREFLPFLPLTVSHPKGPIDNQSPFCANSSPESARSFWNDSSAELFKSARELFNLFQTCSDWKLLAETPLVVFASYMIATLGVYSTHFPWMDVSQSSGGETDMTMKATELVTSFIPKFRIAEGWFKTIGRLHHLFSRTKKDLRRNYTSDMPSPSEQQGRSQLPSMRLVDVDFIHLDNILGPDTSTIQDFEMTDAPDAKTILVQADRGHAENVARQTWDSLNDQHAQQESNGLPYTGQQSPGATRSSYPPISPQTQSQPYTPSSLPQFPYNSPYQPTNASASGPVQAPEKIETVPVRATSQPWTQEKVESWLQSLETVFGANDVVAFAEALDWTDFSTTASPVKGWLKLAWT